MTIGTLSVDVRGAHAFGDFTREWEAQMGRSFPLAPLTPATVADFRVRSHGVRIRDVMFNRVESRSAIRTVGGVVGAEDHVRLWIARRGAWLLGARQGSELEVPAGRFAAQGGRLSHFAATAHTDVQVLVLPADALPRMRGRMASGSAGAAEVRLLTAHADMIHKTLDELGPAGVDAVRDTLVELSRAVVLGELDDVEPRLAPALAQAARELADRQLTDPGLCPETLARKLNVSVRTLQRAFAADGQSLSAYIRDRRLEEARRALTSTGRRASVSEIAVCWQFADSSHFARVFRRRYGQTPSEYAESSVRRSRSPVPD
jgi:AraC-like DNA-binding protein